ncbi:MAG: hypothetical protein OXH14_02170 [Alphaproteobacteria bacterium]|nr:hypothetical protein [Alphaproteobacteria bacterium]
MDNSDVAICRGDVAGDLAAEGLTDFHIYTLDKAEVSIAVCGALRIGTRQPGLSAA